VQLSIKESLQELDAGFFRMRYDRCTDTEKLYMLCMTKQKNGPPYDTGEISKCLGKQPNQSAPIRSNLIEKGFIFSVGHGKIDFSVPLFDEFLKRNHS
jgi:hypothetical protein